MEMYALDMFRQEKMSKPLLMFSNGYGMHE